MLGFFRPLLYITISPDNLTIKNVKTGKIISETPELAHSDSPDLKILGVGKDARPAALLHPSKILNPFQHPRSLISDFIVAEEILKRLMRKVLGRSFLFFAPKVIIHPLGNPLGGFTQVEMRAFHDLAVKAGASKVYIKFGEPLTDQQILHFQMCRSSDSIHN